MTNANQIITSALSGVVREKDEMQCYKAWDKYLSKHLEFPFDALIYDSMDSEVFMEDDKISVKKIDNYVDLYGLIVEVRAGRKKYFVALCTLEVSDRKSMNYKLIDAYNEWFHNK